MFVVEDDVKHDLRRVVIRPNCSLSWRANKFLLLGFSVLVGLVAGFFAWHGFWMVLPFAGLELLALFIGLYLVAQRSQECQVISIDSQSVSIEIGRRRVEQRWVLVRFWARVVLERCPKQWYPSRLLIRSHGKVVEIGRFLNEDERHRLAKELSRSL